MKFLCVPCDSPMKLQTVGPPDRGSLSIVYACPECGYEMAMLTNAYETQAVQSLGVKIGPAEASAETGKSSGCPSQWQPQLLPPPQPQAPPQWHAFLRGAHGSDGRYGSGTHESAQRSEPAGRMRIR